MNSDTPTTSKPTKKRSKGRPLQANAERNKEQLLSDALSLFLEKGYAGSSIEGIARHAGVSKNTIYLQFQTKQNLFQQATRFGLISVFNELEIPLEKDIPFENALLIIIQRIQALAANHHIQSLTRLLIAEAQRFPSLAPSQLINLHQMMQPIANYLAEASIENKLNIKDPSAACFDLSIMALGGFNFLLSEPEKSQTALDKRAIEVRDIFLKAWSQ